MYMHTIKFRPMSLLRAAIIFATLLSTGELLLGQTANVSTQVATTPLSAAQLEALHGSPVQLVPAPGAGQVIVPLAAVVTYKSGSAGYAVDNASHLSIYEGLASNSITEISSVNLTGQVGSQVYLGLGLNGFGAAQATLDNAPLMIQNDSSVEWSNGNGTVTVTVYYVVVPLQ